MMFGKKEAEPFEDKQEVQSAPAVVTKTNREIIDGVKRFSNYFKCVIDLAAKLDEVEDIDRCSSEADARLKEKRAEEKLIDARLTVLKAEVQAESDKKTGHLNAAKEIIDAANTARDRLINDARTEAQKIIDAANTKADGITADAKRDKKQLEADTEALRTEHAELLEKIGAKKTEHQQLQGKIDTAKSAITRVLQQDLRSE